MSTEPKPDKPGKRAALYVIVVLGTTLLYPLSIGPVWWLYQTGRWSEATYTAVVERVYPPFWWCNRNFEPMAKFTGWYLNLWSQYPVPHKP